MHLLDNPLTQAFSKSVSYLLWPLHVTLGKLPRMFICPYLFDDSEYRNGSLYKTYKETRVITLFSENDSDNTNTQHDVVNCSSKLEGYDGVSYTLSPDNVSHDAQLKHVMVFLGNAQLVDQAFLNAWAKYAIDNQVRVTVIEHPGAIQQDIKRKPRVFNDLINNGVEAFSAIKKQFNLKSDEIGLYGASLGGAIATQVASRCYKTKEDCPYLLVDRSFASITSVVIGWILPSKPRSFLGLALFTLVQIPLAIVVYSVVKPLLLLTGWEAHTGVYYANLPNSRKDYLFVRTHKNDRKNGDHRGDGIITRLASLDSSLFLIIPRTIRKYWTKWFSTKEHYTALKNERASHKIIITPAVSGRCPDDFMLHNMPFTYFHDHTRAQKTGDTILTDWIKHHRPTR
jgi:hypothetical protein